MRNIRFIKLQFECSTDLYAILGIVVGALIGMGYLFIKAFYFYFYESSQISDVFIWNGRELYVNGDRQVSAVVKRQQQFITFKLNYYNNKRKQSASL